MTDQQVLRYTQLCKRRMDILLHSGASWLPEYETELKSMRFITAPAYIDTVGESIKRARGEEDRSKVYKECDVLVLDDIGAQAGSKWQEQELFNLVNKRMEHGKITIYTSNMDANALNVDARTRDRIIKTSIVLQMPEENLRKKKAAAEQQSFLQMILQQQGR